MNIGNILVVSRTPWSETPRIRHQLSRLLRDIGYEIYYLEVIFKRNPLVHQAEKGIHVITIKETFHHQLKPFEFLNDFDSYLLQRAIKKVLPKIDFKAIVNFNYDNDFVFSLFKNTPTVTVINDDFYAMAKPWMKTQVLKRLAKTVRASKFNLSVSYSLDRQLKQFTTNAELFLPWSGTPYIKPKAGLKRDVILYYGFISRLDLKLVDALYQKKFKIRFIGPIEGNGHILKKKYTEFPNFEFIDPMPLEDVYIDDVFCSVALYDANLEMLKAITASNRMFQLLSLGLPLVYPNLQNLILAPKTVIAKGRTFEEYIQSIEYFRDNFDMVQPDIEDFLKDHTVENRITYIANLISTIDKVANCNLISE